ncbi:sugar transporter ERD6-like 5 isoform X2 [Gossypium hirsutum]|uniref:Sugar transporter ERD6-like 5 isoform X2 n=1 Tax=Gossypium hirsutum TaxID=3635 RepID=A0ABM2YTM6_GOSHI|nr:sugar transporter ERD6-like 5 isoform X2 [Gossypium hirsutum]
MSEGILDIFQKKYVRPLLTVAGVLVLMNLGGINALTGVLVLMNLGGINALTYYSGAIFVSAGVSSMVGLITLAATQTVIGILGATLIDKLLNWNNNHQYEFLLMSSRYEIKLC